jgi:hypothetical protein
MVEAPGRQLAVCGYTFLILAPPRNGQIRSSVQSVTRAFASEVDDFVTKAKDNYMGGTSPESSSILKSRLFRMPWINQGDHERFC